MHELGPATPEVDAIIQHEAGSWDIWFEGEVCIALAWRLAEPRVTLSIALGEVPEPDAGASYAALLKANLAWSAQGSVRAVMCESGHLMLIAEPTFDSGQLSGFQQQLRRFVCQAAQFSGLLRQAARLTPAGRDPDCFASLDRA